ncbi:MAG: ROK family protein [Planctomycetes bacterium]|nr:ROK family protein [Planctomycetota bacterium]
MAKPSSGTGRKNSSPAPKRILAIDIGGTKVKYLLSGEVEPRRFSSGKRMTPTKMVESLLSEVGDWKYDAISIGYPGLVGDHGPRSEPGNLGHGWVGFDFAAAFGCPVRIINDAAMQALGSYDGGRMLFLGLGTGLGSALISECVLVPLELGQLYWEDGKVLSDILGHRGLKKLGKSAWRQAVLDTVTSLMSAFVCDSIVIGGGNAKLIRDLPPGISRGNNLTAFRGGFRLWNVDDVTTQADPGAHHAPEARPAEWRLI